MRKLHKLTFDTKEDWIVLRNTLVQADEDGNYPSKKVDTFQLLSGERITINEVGNVPIPIEYDENGEPTNTTRDDDGNVIPIYHEDWAVDVMAEDVIDALTGYIVVDAPNQWYNSFTGAFELVEATPTSDWTVAEIKAWLDSKGISYTSSMLKAELLALC